MVTISQALEELIAQSPFLEEGLADGLINLSSLARKLQPQIQTRLYKDVQTGAIVMALKRLSERLEKRYSHLPTVLANIKDITVRSNLMEFTYASSPTLMAHQSKLMQAIADQPKTFLTITDGVFESSLFCSAHLAPQIEEIFAKETMRSKQSGLSSITLIIPEEATYVPGVYYAILKRLAWEGINFIEVVSSFTELTIFLEEKNVDRAFSVLKKLY